MNESQILDIARDGVWVMIVLSAPPLLLGLVIGFMISLFQALTSLQEATLVFVPKMLGVFTFIMFLLPFMIRHISEFTHRIMDLIIALP